MHDDQHRLVEHGRFDASDVGAIVLGVHRSGTSMVTAGLQAIGCNLGEFPLNSNDENPRGFFEHPEFRAFNDQLLHKLGASWDNWGFTADQDFLSAEFASDRSAARELLWHNFGNRAPFALKDPRLSTLLPFWETVFAEVGLAPRRILVLRDPREVAASQEKRAHKNPGFYKIITKAESMHAMWCVTMDTILRSLPDDETLIVRHADLYDRPTELLHEIAGFLGLSPVDEKVNEFVADFIDPSLRRSDASDQPVFSLSMALYEALVPTHGVGRLTRDDAKAALRTVPGLDALRMLLPAVFESLSRVTADTKRDQASKESLVGAMHLFADIAIRDGSARAISENLERLEEIAADSDEHSHLLMFRKARFEERLGAFQAACKIYGELMESTPTFAPAYIGRMRMLSTIGRAEEAKLVRSAGAKRFPHHPHFKDA